MNIFFCVLIKGNFAEVYKAKYTRLTKEVHVAVKKLKKEINDSEREKFIKEGFLLGITNHPNIVRFIGFVYNHIPLMIVTEYLAGKVDSPIYCTMLIKMLKKSGQCRTFF